MNDSGYLDQYHSKFAILKLEAFTIVLADTAFGPPTQLINHIHWCIHCSQPISEGMTHTMHHTFFR